jgi:hypothetical protein
MVTLLVEEVVDIGNLQVVVLTVVLVAVVMVQVLQETPVQQMEEMQLQILEEVAAEQDILLQVLVEQVDLALLLLNIQLW